MKLVIELNDNPREDDIIIFKDNKWVLVNKASFLDGVEKEIESLTNELNSLKEDFAGFKDSVNNKLKEYHDILQLLTKGENE